MRITNNTLNESIVRQIQQLGSQQAKLQNQVATGQRVFQPEDDPTAVGRVLNLESEQRQLAQFQSNADRAYELQQASFSGLQQIKKVSDRTSEIATLGAGAIDPDASRAYGSEVNQLLEQALQLANTKFRNDYLYAGTAVDTAPFTATRDAQGNITSIAFTGNTESSSIQLSENASVTTGTSATTNQGLGDFLNHLVSLRDALNNADSTAVTAAGTNLIGSEDVLVNALAEHGGMETRIDANRSQLQDRAQSLESLVSAETDLDMPSTIVKLNQTQTAYQAALQSAANIMKISLLDYIK
jgi:flagellar hook-associated protein 3 FlgL